MKHAQTFAGAGRQPSGQPAARHAFVGATLTAGERVAPWAQPGQPDADPLPAYTRTAVLCDDDGPVARVAYHRGRFVVLAAGDCPPGSRPPATVGVRLQQQHLTGEG
jgi:hypothetical protein